MVIGIQFPSVSHAPKYVHNEWESVRDLCKAYGLVLDPWQENVLKASLGEKADYTWAASRVGLSVPRQSGKTALFEARELAGLLIFEERLILHSAHLVPTALEGFQRIKGYFDNYDDLRKKVRRIREANGEQGIELLNGQRLRFMARSKSSGRGFSADALLLDEAQELSDQTWAAILPTTSARPNPQIWLAGTPPSPDMAGEVFTRLRDAGKAGKDPRLCWMEWSCEGSIDLDERSNWAKANPGLGVRITSQAIQDERNSMDDVTFARERLGMWASASQLQVIPADAWERCATQDVPKSGRVAYGVDVNPERTRAAIGVAREGESVHVEVAAVGPDGAVGPEWVVDWFVKTMKNRPVTIVIDGSSPAASLIPALKAARLPLTVTGALDMAKACGGFYDAAMTGTLSHFDQDELNTALRGSSKRNIGTEGGWGWNRKEHLGDITPLVAVTLAAYGMANARPAVSRAPRRIY